MSVTLNAGSGGATCGTDTVTGTPNIDYQIVKIGYSVSGTTPTQVSASNPLPANVAQLGGNAIKTGSGNGSTGSLSVYLATDQPTLTNAQPVAQSGSWTVTANLGTLNGAALDASVTGLQVAQGSTTAGQKGGLTLGAVTTAAPTYTTAQTSPLSLTTAGALRVDASGTTQPVSGAVTANAGSGTFNIQSNASVNLSQIAGNAPKTGSGAGSITGSLNVYLATDQPSLTNALPVSQSGSWTVTVSGTTAISASSLPLPTGAAADTSVNGILVAQGSTTSGEKGPLVQGAVTTGSPTYATGQTNPLSLDTAGNLRVNIVAGGISAGTAGSPSANVLTVQGIGGATPIFTTDVPTAGQGSSVSSFVSTAAVQATNVKAIAGTIYGVEFFNNSATPVYVRLYDKATAPATTDTPIWRGMVPGNTAGAGFVKTWKNGLKTSNGIGFRCTAAIADNDATALSANTVLGNLEYA